jgi:hypothetical protein
MGAGGFGDGGAPRGAVGLHWVQLRLDTAIDS